MWLKESEHSVWISSVNTFQMFLASKMKLKFKCSLKYQEKLIHLLTALFDCSDKSLFLLKSIFLLQLLIIWFISGSDWLYQENPGPQVFTRIYLGSSHIFRLPLWCPILDLYYFIELVLIFLNSLKLQPGIYL